MVEHCLNNATKSMMNRLDEDKVLVMIGIAVRDIK